MTAFERAMDMAAQVARRYYAAMRSSSLRLAAAALRVLVRIEQLTGYSPSSALFVARIAI